MKHIPVLLKEVIGAMNLSKGKFIIDGTIDGGGHAREILRLIMPKGLFLGVDLDSDLIKETKKSLLNEFYQDRKNILIEKANYKDLDLVLKRNHLPKADGILLDLGFSTYHLEDAKRGFSFQKEELLDMRYDLDSDILAMEVVNFWDEKALADLIWKFGEERFSRRIAKAIVNSRKIKEIKTATQLAQIIKNAVPAFYRKRKINPATKTFQALRIYVNRELENLAEFLEKVPNLVSSRGRLAIISFHSLEDRLVKKAFVDFKKRKIANLITKKPIVPTKEEILKNPKSRSAKLRVVEFI